MKNRQADAGKRKNSGHGAMNTFFFYFFWWARKSAKKLSPAPLLSLTVCFSWRGKNSLCNRRSMILNKPNPFNFQMIRPSAAQTVSPLLLLCNNISQLGRHQLKA
jgi:hypothetical protein